MALCPLLLAPTGGWPARVAAMYSLVKHIHVATMVISLGGFFLRGFLLMRASPLMKTRWVRVLPHVNDTVLLLAALSLSIMSGQYPFVDDWVTAKVLGVIAYIILGSLALREGSSARTRVVSWVSAMAVFGWIVSVALTRHPAGILKVMF